MLGVTSFSKEGYELYGKACLASLKNWPCKFIVYHEGEPDFKSPQIEYRSLYDIRLIREFLHRLSSVDGADGLIEGKYDYRFDASRFCRKVFCMDALFGETDKLFWLDADTLTHKKIPEGFLNDLLHGVPFCYLGRDKFRTETGFLGFNTAHDDFPLFRSRYLLTYTGGAFMGLEAWEDTAVFDYARGDIKGNNLNTTALQGIDHCWPHTVLGEYIEHFKGRRKFVLGNGQRRDHIKVSST
jgi:hypothetical protein